MVQTVAIGVGFLLLLLQCTTTDATAYVVGNKQGWDLDPGVREWPKGKHFKAGDVLIFNYKNPLFIVEAVDESQYKKCCSDGRPKDVYSSGQDRVVLKKGKNFFICADIDFCGYGMKLEVTAE